MTCIKLCARRHRKMTSGGEAHDSDSRRIEAPFGRMRSKRSERALRIAELDRVVIRRSQPVAQHECCNPKRVEEIRDLPSFVIRCEAAICAARTDDHRGRIRPDLTRKVHRQRWDVRLFSAERAWSR